MTSSLKLNIHSIWKPIVVSLAILFLFSAVLPKLIQDWWSDENYSHGLLIPFVVGYIIWSERDRLRASAGEPNEKGGLFVVCASLGLLILATLGSELFTQRFSLVFMLAGVILYFFGIKVVRLLVVPFLLLLLSIPLPQILFNKIALPLQLLASKIAGYLLVVLGIGPTRNGNVIEIIPRGTDQIIGLEVVEACSGIRSLMTLAALAVILVYLTRDKRPRSSESFLRSLNDIDFIRGVILVISAAPIALATNALRVTVTGLLTYYWGLEAATGPGHDALGWITFFGGLVLLIVENEILKWFLSRWNAARIAVSGESYSVPARVTPVRSVLVLLFVLIIGGLCINWFDRRTEISLDRQPLSEMPLKMGEWWKVGGDTRFNIDTEDVLKATDYVMRNYYTVYGHRSNLYVGFYDSQRTGATYHSPQNCLPGSGWQMTGGKTVSLQTPAGRRLEVNRYIVEKGNQREVMVYWYQGRGLTTASEYIDRMYKIYDSMFTRRSDGAMVRVLTKIVDGDEDRADAEAMDFAANVADSLTPFVPQ